MNQRACETVDPINISVSKNGKNLFYRKRGPGNMSSVAPDTNPYMALYIVVTPILKTHCQINPMTAKGELGYAFYPAPSMTLFISSKRTNTSRRYRRRYERQVSRP